MSAHAAYRIYQDGTDEIAVCRCGWWACESARNVGAAEAALQRHLSEEEAR